MPPATRRGARRRPAASAGSPRRRRSARSKRPAVCGVSAISGTSTIAERPRSSAAATDAQVDLGLAAAGDAVQQQRRARAAASSRSATAARAALWSAVGASCRPGPGAHGRPERGSGGGGRAAGGRGPGHAAAAPRRHRQRQDRGLPARGGRCALERGRSAIVLVPEIALTPQTAGRFVERFGDSVAVLHSQLAARERYDEWRRMRTGEARVCVGPRSAVFAPVRRPRPDRDRRGARRLVQAGGRPPLRRARAWPSAAPREEGAVLLAGSATPRPESRAAPTSASRCPGAWTTARCRRSSSWACRASHGRAPRAHARARSTRCGAARRRRSCC